MHRLSRLLLAILLPVSGLALSACELTPPSRDFPELTYGHLAPLRFDVASVEVAQAYQPSAEAPNVELLFPVRPDQAAANWARDRLQAVGASRRMRYTVREAPVIETALETKTGLTGVVTRDQSERYDASLSVEVEILDDGGRREGSALARVARSVTVAENATLLEREEVWYELTRKLMDDLDTQLEEALKRVFGRYLR
jgi:hypothetical protein